MVAILCGALNLVIWIKVPSANIQDLVIALAFVFVGALFGGIAWTGVEPRNWRRRA